MKPRILVSQRLEKATSYEEVREMLDVRWGDFLQVCGLTSIPISIHTPVEDYAALEPQGVLLTGGNDLAVIKPDCKLSAARPQVEKNLLEFAKTKELPVLGICRGMQMLCHVLGSSIQPCENHVAKDHILEIKAQTRFASIYGKSVTVNSYHNYAVTTLAPSLTLAASSEDHVIEAVEHKDLPWLGLMWHPERCQTYSAKDIQLFKQHFHTLPCHLEERSDERSRRDGISPPSGRRNDSCSPEDISQ